MNELPDEWVNSVNRTTPLNKLIVDCAKTGAVSSRKIPLNLTSLDQNGVFVEGIQ